MRAMTATKLLLIASIAGFSACPVQGQQSTAIVPQIITSGRGDVETKPDRASLEFTVETRAASATAAAVENGRRQRAVLDTIQRLGIPVDQIQTASLQVTPEVVYPGSGQAPKVTGYIARNSVRVEVQKLDQIGSLVDAALGRGANGVSGLNFYSSKSAEIRRDALARAVSAARLDAEAMARAAGYQLGALIEISTGAVEPPVMLGMDFRRSGMAAMSAEPTPVNPGTLKVSETVTVRWFVKP